MAFFYGLGTGVAMSLMLGTVFFALIQTSIDHGYRGGLLIALGVVLSDVGMITLAAFGARLLPPVPNFDAWVSAAGGALLLALGISNVLKRPVAPPAAGDTKLGHWAYFVGKGFLLNLLNPANFFIWATVTANLRANLHYDGGQATGYFAGCLTAIFGTELGITFFAYRLKRYFTPAVLRNLNRVVGVAFIGFGLRLLWSAWR